MYRDNFILKRAFCFILCVALCFSAFCFVASAEREQDKALISIHASSLAPQPGETITVTAKIDNYVSMVPFISAMQIEIEFDDEIFDCVDAKSLLNANEDDAISVVEQDGIVSFYYVYSHNKPLEKISNFKLFSFDLTVKEEISENISSTFEVKKALLYNNNDKFSAIGCQSPMIIDTVTVWASDAALLINGSEMNSGTYSSDVTLDFKASSAQITRNSGSVATIQSGYKCIHNGEYKLTFVIDGKTRTESFKVNKKVAMISLIYDEDFNNLEYMVGVDPSIYFARGNVKITYSDGTSGELPLSDSDFTITGYDITKAGEQSITIDFYGTKTNHTIKFTEKNVSSVEIVGSLIYNEYLVNDSIDTSGVTVKVKFDDGTNDEAYLTSDMLSYDNTVVGTQNVTVLYGSFEYKDAFTVSFISRERFDTVVSGLNSLDVSSLTSADSQRVTELVNLYNSFNEVEKRAFSEEYRTKLANALSAVGGSSLPTDTSSNDTSPSTDGGDSQSSTSTIKIVIIVLIVILVLAALAGGGYFLFAYLKRKREDNEEFFYNENETNIYEDDFLPNFDEDGDEKDDENDDE